MTLIARQIGSASQAICDNIATLSSDRPLLSQNMLSQARNLVEGVMVLVYKDGDEMAEFTYQDTKPALVRVSSANREVNFLARFHKFLQESASHYTMDGDTSERLMLKYYEYLLRVRTLLRNNYSIETLANLESFPLDLDPSLKEYHQKISRRVEVVRAGPRPIEGRNRYYIHGVRPFFVDGRIYYEVTFNDATDRVSKFDRVIAFTDIDLTDKYAANLTLVQESIDVLGQTMPIMVIYEWEVSVRPCEFNNFAKIFGIRTDVQSRNTEYKALMEHLTETGLSLINVIALPEKEFQELYIESTKRSQVPRIFPVLAKARGIVTKNKPGSNVVRYLMLRLNNQLLKEQYTIEPCSLLSNLRLKFGCIPFDTMPFCTSPLGHNPRFGDLIACLEVDGRTHELLARKIKNNVEQHGMLYTPLDQLEHFGELQPLISKYNAELYYKHTSRRMLEEDKGHLFIHEYENDTVDIVNELQSYVSSGIDGYEVAVSRWMDETALEIDDSLKEDALKSLFSRSRAALIYGAAGTGKSTMINYVANYFSDKDKLFLAHTNPAVNNLERRVNTKNATFKTIASQIRNGTLDVEYDLLVIDECSTVSNADLLKVLQHTSFKLLLLVGDTYQIESIQFGNWFEIIPAFIPSSSVFELRNPFRTTNKDLLSFWSAVRNMKDDIAEVLAQYGYSTILNESLFEAQRDDEIILCLNYDGLYGINNINRFLQSSNPGNATTWGVATYKVGDPILFNDSERFRGVIYNNLKGKIIDIQKTPGMIRFDVEVDRPITELDTYGTELQWVEDSTVRFFVHERGSTDDDDETSGTNVPFQVAYAVSIHKAQGLEYDSVKIVITDANEEDISHSIFYTAVTRARKELKIYWTPETQQAILEGLTRPNSDRDVGILSNRRSLTPVR